MPLNRPALASDLERILGTHHASSADAAAAWSGAYQSYASGALTGVASLPVTAAVNAPLLLAGFVSGLSAPSPAAAAALVAQGVTGYWQAMAWLGPVAAGTTAFAGNPALAGALASVFGDLGGKPAAEKARELASAFDAGAKAVMVADVNLVSGVTVVGPIA